MVAPGRRLGFCAYSSPSIRLIADGQAERVFPVVESLLSDVYMDVDMCDCTRQVHSSLGSDVVYRRLTTAVRNDPVGRRLCAILMQEDRPFGAGPPNHPDTAAWLLMAN